MSTRRLESMLAIFAKTRAYTEDMLAHVQPDDWFRQPAEGITHIAWQVGHLAVAEHSLAMKRIRGTQPQDAQLVSREFSALFGKGSTPTGDPSIYPNPEEIRRVLDDVHRTAMAELSTSSDDMLDQEVDPIHPMFRTKLESLQWCVQHEMLHVGQIALLRRLFGEDYLR